MEGFNWGLLGKTFLTGAIPLAIFLWLVFYHTLVLVIVAVVIGLIIFSLMIGATIIEWREDRQIW